MNPSHQLLSEILRRPDAKDVMANAICSMLDDTAFGGVLDEDDLMTFLQNALPPESDNAKVEAQRQRNKSMKTPRNYDAGSVASHDLTDEQLMQVLTERYAPSVIPTCRVCGAALSIGESGGGEPTRWYCSVMSEAKGEAMDWDHLSNSRWEDRRQGGDSRVMELVRRFKSNVQGDARREDAGIQIDG